MDVDALLRAIVDERGRVPRVVTLEVDDEGVVAGCQLDHDCLPEITSAPAPTVQGALTDLLTKVRAIK